MKKRILLVNEASYLSTGYAVYGHEVLSRLYNTGKYELAELGAYGADDDPRNHSIPWRFYPNQPADNSPEFSAYNAKPSNLFGEWRFEQACLDFKQHVTIDVRDWWFSEFEERSPFRPFFKYIVMPTVDSIPLDEQWLASYIKADAVLSYSEFGKQSLINESANLVKFAGIASPGANLIDFPFVEDKKLLKKQLGLPENVLIIGTVMRNQERKLYPDLIEAFANFLLTAPSDIAKRTYLYIHTSYPDLGWHIPKLIKNNRVGNKVLLTYHCQNCGTTYPAFYQDVRTFCKTCQQYTATLPTVKYGVSREALGKVMNLFDIYVQYSVCEGFGMPLVEAAATGAIIFGVDYSATADIIKKLDGVPIKVQRMFYDARTYSRRALPDNQDLVDKLIDVLSLSDEEIAYKRKSIRSLVEREYSWDNTAAVWEHCFDNIDVLSNEASWQSPSRISYPNLQCPQNLNNAQFIEWAIYNIAGRPELLNGYIYLRLLRDLNWGATQISDQGMFFSESSVTGNQPPFGPYSRQDVIQELIRACENKNMWEKQRLGIT